MLVYAGTISASVGIIARVLTGPCPVSSWDNNNGGSPSPVTARAFFDTMLCNINDQTDALPSDMVALGNASPHLLFMHFHIFSQTLLSTFSPNPFINHHTQPSHPTCGISILDPFSLVRHLQGRSETNPRQFMADRHRLCLWNSPLQTMVA